jgi:adenylate kinase
MASLPRVDSICDVCGGDVIQREDDTEAAIRRRLDLYEAQTAPLVARYAAMGKLVTVPGDGPLDEVTNRLTAAIDPMLDAANGRQGSA